MRRDGSSCTSADHSPNLFGTRATGAYRYGKKPCGCLSLNQIIFGTHAAEPLRKPFSGQHVVFVDDGVFSFEPAETYHLHLVTRHNPQTQTLPISFLSCSSPDTDGCNLTNPAILADTLPADPYAALSPLYVSPLHRGTAIAPPDTDRLARMIAHATSPTQCRAPAPDPRPPCR